MKQSGFYSIMNHTQFCTLQNTQTQVIALPGHLLMDFNNLEWISGIGLGGSGLVLEADLKKIPSSFPTMIRGKKNKSRVCVKTMRSMSILTFFFIFFYFLPGFFLFYIF